MFGFTSSKCGKRCGQQTRKSETQSRFLDSHEIDEHWPKSHGMELQEMDLNGFLVQS